MSAMFITGLAVSKIDHKHWKLLDDLMVTFTPGFPMKDGGTLIDLMVPAGFVTDFASVPRTPLSWWVGGGVGDASAVVHDYFCVNREIVTSAVAADIFEACLRVEIGVSAWRRVLMVRAVRLLGPRF
jgi:hypothetical protein